MGEKGFYKQGIIIVSVIIIFVIGVIFFQRGTSEDEPQNGGNGDPQASPTQPVANGGDPLVGSCEGGLGGVRNFDGVMEQREDDLFYLRGNDGVLTLYSLTSETAYKEIVFSADFELLEEKDINFDDVKLGDSVSLIVVCDDTTSYEDTIQTVKLVTVLVE
jgi:hypothetical protein